MKKIRDWIAAIVVSGACAVSAATQAPGDDTRPRTDYVTAAQGAWLVSISFTGAETGPRRSHAFETYDGLATPRAMLYSASPEAELSLVYDLPALTSFDRFAVPEVNEVPSAGVTFFREVRVFGSTDDAETGYELIAQATLQTHARSGETTELEIVSQHPIRFLKLVLRGGIQDLQEQMTYEWSELIGNGSQDAVPLEGGFTGVWNTQLPDIDRSAGLIQLKQQGIAVTGCYGGRDITGTVSGSILRASGVGRSDGTPSQHVMLRSITPAPCVAPSAPTMAPSACLEVPWRRTAVRPTAPTFPSLSSGAVRRSTCSSASTPRTCAPKRSRS